MTDRPLTAAEAVDIVCEAADKWADEIRTYIAPEAADDAEAKRYQSEADAIAAALVVLAGD
jgi:hypothetical protein